MPFVRIIPARFLGARLVHPLVGVLYRGAKPCECLSTYTDNRTHELVNIDQSKLEYITLLN